MILRGLEFCHAHWVVHRDIKPNNFLVTATGELKLVGCSGRQRLWVAVNCRAWFAVGTTTGR